MMASEAPSQETFEEAKKAAKEAVGRVIDDWLRSKKLTRDQLPLRPGMDGIERKTLKRENFPPTDRTKHTIQSDFGMRNNFTLEDWENFEVMKDMEVSKAYKSVINGKLVPIVEVVQEEETAACGANAFEEITDKEIEDLSLLFGLVLTDKEMKISFFTDADEGEAAGEGQNMHQLLRIL